MTLVPEPIHRPVLVTETVNALVRNLAGTYVDATFGAGGHSMALLTKLGPAAQLIAMDADVSVAMIAARIDDDRFQFHHANFTELDEVLGAQNNEGVDGVLMDLGMSGMQLDDAERGFSFNKPGPLDMRMDTSVRPSLVELLRHVSERRLGKILREFGEERHYRTIAARIIRLREQGKLNNTLDIATVCGSRYGRRHPATKVFQALRIWVNDELTNLSVGLVKAACALRRGGRLVVISFHSLEDRIVKHFIHPPDGSPGPLVREAKPVRSGAEELAVNLRARSALLRVGVKP